jgi:hypothetical protein
VLIEAFLPRSGSLDPLPFAGPLWLVGTVLVDVAVTCSLTRYFWKVL